MSRRRSKIHKTPQQIQPAVQRGTITIDSAWNLNINASITGGDNQVNTESIDLDAGNDILIARVRRNRN